VSTLGAALPRMDRMARRLTIAVPTYNRSQSLQQTLDSLAALEIPAGFEAECVVVNNGSTDDTADVASRFAADSPIHTRCVLEPRSGSSYARNRGFFEARGDFVLFIDDDAIADHNWVTALIMEMERRRLDAACGMVLPRWSAKPPRWLGPSVAIKLAVHDEAQLSHQPPAALDSIHNYFSANVGFRRETFARFGGFS
jgi:glycosyltransferase involved in cell wall biosynthesis